MGVDVAEVYEALLLSGAHTPDSLNGPASLDDSEGCTLIDVQEDESTPLEDVYNKARLQDVIGTLDQKHQDVLNLRFTEGRTKAEIARSMGSTSQTSRSFCRVPLMKCGPGGVW
jgi:DNA-directed RNA polymerase specialized sigma subunit